MKTIDKLYDDWHEEPSFKDEDERCAFHIFNLKLALFLTWVIVALLFVSIYTFAGGHNVS